MEAVQLVRWQAEPEPPGRSTSPRPVPARCSSRSRGPALHSDIHLNRGPRGHPSPGSFRSRPDTTTRRRRPRRDRARRGRPRLLVYGPWGCGTRWHCAAGAENLCPDRRFRGCGLGVDGGLAEYVVVPSPRLLVPLGDLDPVEAAPLTDAGLTSYHAIKPELPRLLRRDGGRGHRRRRARPPRRPGAPRAVACPDRGRRHPRERAQSSRVTPARARRSTRAASTPPTCGPRRAARAILVLDFVGSDQTLSLAASVLAAGGQICMVGLGGGALLDDVRLAAAGVVAAPLELGHAPRAARGRRARARRGLNIEVERLRLEDAVDGYRRLGRGEVTGRAGGRPVTARLEGKVAVVTGGGGLGEEMCARLAAEGAGRRPRPAGGARRDARPGSSAGSRSRPTSATVPPSMRRSRRWRPSSARWTSG